MTKSFVGLGLGFGLLIAAACDDASAQAKPSLKDTGRQQLQALHSKTAHAPAAQIAPTLGEKTCSKFLPNVGLVMTVPCSDLPADIPPVVAAVPPARVISPPVRLAADTLRKPSHRVSEKICSEILQRIQLDDASDDDQEQLRNGC